MDEKLLEEVKNNPVRLSIIKSAQDVVSAEKPKESTKKKAKK